MKQCATCASSQLDSESWLVISTLGPNHCITAFQMVKKAAIYARTSSHANAKSDSHSRQFHAATGAAKKESSSLLKKVKKVGETVSGMLPLKQRKKLMALLNGDYSHIFCENVRALSRKASTLEDIYEQAKSTNTCIVVSDADGVFNFNATPAENFQRRVLAAVAEFERDTIVQRLASGLKAKKEKIQKETGKKNVKVNGRKSYLEHALEKCKTKAASKKMRRQLAALCCLQTKGKLTIRQLASKASACLGLKKKMGKDAAVTLSRQLGVSA